MLEKEKIVALGAGAAVSVFLLILLFGMEASHPDLMDMQVHWVVYSLTPLVLFAVCAGVIRGFKAFGVELETRLSSQLGDFETNLQSSILKVSSIGATTKGAVSRLERLSNFQRQKIGVLVFETRNVDYYDERAILEYLKMLPSLRFIVILRNGRFELGVSIKDILIPSIPVEQLLDSRMGLWPFLSFLQSRPFDDHSEHPFAPTNVATQISSNATLKNVLKQISEAQSGLYIVEDERGLFQNAFVADQFVSLINDAIEPRPKK